MYPKLATSRRESLRNVSKHSVLTKLITRKELLLSSSNDGTLSPDVSVVRKLLPAIEETPAALKIGHYLISLCHPIKVEQDLKVYKAVCLSSGRKFICKVISSAAYQNYKRSQLLVPPHPHINCLSDIVYSEGSVYLFIRQHYGDLHSYVRERKMLSETEAIGLFTQIMSAVWHCLSSGVLVRDLKLRKFTFSDAERTHLVLCDLDDAVLVSNNLTQNGSIEDPELFDDSLVDRHGCPAYVSPEILSIKPRNVEHSATNLTCPSIQNRTAENPSSSHSASTWNVQNSNRAFVESGIAASNYSGRAAAVWSLGVLLYTMVSGQYPFHDADPATLFAKIRTGRFTMPDFLSPLVKSLITGMLCVDPEERLTLSEVMKHPWLLAPSTERQTIVEKYSSGRLFKIRSIAKCSDQLVPEFKSSLNDTDCFFS